MIIDTDKVCCKTCEHYELYKNCCNGFCKILYTSFYPEDFCSYWKDREKVGEHNEN